MAMSAEHKAAIKKGRQEATAVKKYLTALGGSGGRRTSRERLEAKAARVDEALASESNPLKHLDLLQEKIDTEKALSTYNDAPDVGELEREFLKVAKTYSERKGISYKAWRTVGVSAPVLKAAGIKRTRG